MIIDVKAGGQYELWLEIRDGRIFEHFENDGHYAMRHGIEARDTEITMEQVAELESRYGKNLVAKVKAALDADERR
jgi:hypothetical protein